MGAGGWEGVEGAQQESSLPLRMGIEVKTKENGENVLGPRWEEFCHRPVPGGQGGDTPGWAGREGADTFPRVQDTPESAWCPGGLGWEPPALPRTALLNGNNPILSAGVWPGPGGYAGVLQ